MYIASGQNDPGVTMRAVADMPFAAVPPGGTVTVAAAYFRTPGGGHSVIAWPTAAARAARTLATAWRVLVARLFMRRAFLEWPRDPRLGYRLGRLRERDSHHV